jgi:hypothetical protein
MIRHDNDMSRVDPLTFSPGTRRRWSEPPYNAFLHPDSRTVGSELINPSVTVVELLLMSSIEGLLLFFGEDAVVISVSISLGGQGFALDMITGIH